MPYTTIVAGTTITAAWANASVRDQVVTPFASAAARTSAISSPLEGMASHLADVNSLGVYSGAAWSTIGPVHGALTAWTPAVVQSGAVTTTNTQSSYQRIGRLITGTFLVAVTGSGTAANIVTVTTPVTALFSSSTPAAGTCWLFDSSANLFYPGTLALNSSTTFRLYGVVTAGSQATVTMGTGGGSIFAAGLASSDSISGQFSFEAAADA